MKPITESELARLTGKSWRTVNRRLSEAAIEPLQRTKKSKLYASDVALEAIYAPEGVTGELDLTTERARLAKWQADKTAQDVNVRAGRLVDMREVEMEWARFVLNARNRLLGMPSKLAKILVSQPDPAKIAAEIKREVHEALTELADYSPPDPEAQTDD